MNTPTEPQRASLDDLQHIKNLIKDASGWLHTKGTDQWAEPWPTEEKRDDRVKASLAKRATWLTWDGPIAVATVTSHKRGIPFLWSVAEQARPAVYAHRLIVNRGYAGRGIGAGLLDWVAERAAREYGAEELRIDVWTSNAALHDYYRGIGFSFVRIAENCADYPSRALFRRPIP
jgi:ribosomal protein S18 acetylase RimI-like enzyme